jgi:hypothetical protein
VRARTGIIRLGYDEDYSFGTFPPNSREIAVDGYLARVDPPGQADADTVDRVINQATIEFIGKCQEAQRKFQGGVFLGELREAIRMVRNPAQTLRRQLDDYINYVKGRKGWHKRKRTGSNTWVSEAWLEWNYGWKPLFSDVDSGMAALAELEFSPSRWKFVKPRPSEESVVLEDVGPVTDVYFGQAYHEYRRLQTASVTCGYYGVVDLATDFSGARSWRSGLGFNAGDFVATIWELIPYSFVVDYFTNIGDVLASVSYGDCGIRWKARTLRNEGLVRTYDHRLYAPNLYPDVHKLTTCVLDPGEQTISKKDVTRETIFGDLYPRFSWRLPGLSSKKWLNLAALGRVNLSGDGLYSGLRRFRR